MQRLLPLLLLMLVSVCNAQNWALLHPAYRYNYSDDGTDTISNQIRVMEVDTLGADSIHYTLNLIGVVCDTCPASLGAYCNGCFVWVDQPQFLGYDCLRIGQDWYFNGRDTFLLRMAMEVGEIWPWNRSGTITALFDAEWEQTVLGVNDTLQRIHLSSGDTILLSRSFGIFRISNGSNLHQLIGVEEADVGVQFPDPISYFDFNIGDEFTYAINSVYWANPPGGPVYPVACRQNWKVHILGREEFSDGITYSTSVAYTLGGQGCNGSLAQEPIWPMPQSTWTFERSAVLSNHPILDSYPGQVLDTSICSLGDIDGFDPKYLAQSELNAEGRMRMRSKFIGQTVNGLSGGFNAATPILDNLFPFIAQPLIDVHYEEKIGVINVESVYDQFMADNDMGIRVRLVGAIINGDTIIAPPVIDWTVNIIAHSSVGLLIYPNPVDQTCYISGVSGGERLSLYDLGGRMVLSVQLAAKRTALDVTGLYPGTYITQVDGYLPQRLVIAR